jgi:rhodanese-related sulfurtransferase
MALRDELSQIPFIDAKQFKSLLEGGGTSIIDTRQVEEFNSKHIKGALNFPLGEAGGAIVRVEDGNFAIWVGTLVSNETKLLIVTKQGKESETLQRLARIAYTNIAGVLEGGMDGWNYPTETVERLNLKSSPTALTEALSKGHQLIDIRTLGEYRNNSTHDTINVPLNEIYQRIPTLDKSTQYIVYCSTGYRSVIGSSIMRERGLNTIDIYGGFASISVYSPELTTSGKICPTMKSMIEKLEQQQ